MTKEELIRKHMQESADVVNEALILGRQIAAQHFNLVGNDLVICKVAEMILDNVPFAVTVDEPLLPEEDLSPEPLKEVLQETASGPATGNSEATEEGSGSASGATTDAPAAKATDAKESTKGTAGKAS